MIRDFLIPDKWTFMHEAQLCDCIHYLRVGNQEQYQPGSNDNEHPIQGVRGDSHNSVFIIWNPEIGPIQRPVL